MPTPTQVAKAMYQAYSDSDREAIERLVAPDFHFTSPLDNRLDRETYFERCWPNHETAGAFEFVHVAEAGEQVYLTYVGRSTTGKAFRNTEVVTVRDGQAVEVEVYFGWDVPHKAPLGSFVTDEPGE